MATLKLILLPLVLLCASCAQFRNMRPDVGPLPIDSSKLSDADVVRFAGDITKEVTAYNTAKDGAIRCASDIAACNDRKHVFEWYQQAGFQLADTYCTVYLSQIADSRKRLSAGRRMTNDVGGGISSLMATAVTDATVVGQVGMLFSLSDAFLRNYTETFIPGTDAFQMQSLVFAKRREMESRFTASEPDSIVEVNRRLKEYAAVCSPVGIETELRDVVAAAIAKKTAPIATP